MIPDADRYWLNNAHIPRSLLGQTGQSSPTAAELWEQAEATLAGDQLVLANVEVDQGIIRQVVPAIPPQATDVTGDRAVPSVDLQRKQLWPCFVDMHTHLDKGHSWERTPNGDRTFAGAIDACDRDMVHWTAEDLYRRMTFGLKCSYAHGTTAIRTHLDAPRTRDPQSFDIFRQIQQEWRDRLTLQAVCLTPIALLMGSYGETLADQMAELPGGVLGGVVFVADDLDTQLDRVFALAKDRQLALDLHVDETGDPHADGLRHVARAALRHQFEGRVVCGHCCSLAMQPPSEVRTTLALVSEANIGIVSLPLCNLFLQDRNQSASAQLLQTGVAVQETLATGQTPRWRGVTLLHELQEAGIPVAIANDNCRDPFHGFGDHDMLEVFNLSARIAHLDHPYGQWVHTVTQTPAQLMDVPDAGTIAPGMPADFVIFPGRTFSELLSRSQHQRTVVRGGRAIATELPDYAELDSP